MRVIDLENINYAMRSETQFVLRCEEVFHDKISAAATTILSNKGEKPLVALTGPSGSGKTTTAMRLQEYLQNLGVHVCLLSMDNFFLPLDQRPPEATDWESPYCVNVEQLVSCISQLADGKEADIPWYDFKEGKTGGYRKMQGDKDGIIIAEGIHMLNPLIFEKIRGIANGIYVAPRTRIITYDRSSCGWPAGSSGTTTPEATLCGRPWSGRPASIGARRTTSSPISPTPPSRSTASTTMSRVFWPSICWRSPSSGRS